MADKEVIELKLDEANELLFTMSIQGTDSNTANVRLFCESEEMSFVFEGHTVNDEEIQFIVPRMKGQLRENTAYPGRIEVIVEDRHFTPVAFDIVFKPAAKVFVESMKVNQKKSSSVVIETKNSVPVVKKPAKPEIVPPVVTRVEPVKPVIEERKSATGIDEKTMEEVARSAVQRLLGKK